MEDKNLVSNKINVISFILIVMVIYIHSYNIITIKDIDNPLFIINYFIQYLFSQGVFRTAVPMFFLISGYLFFKNYNNISDYYKKLKKRFKSLFIPFVFWNLFVILIYYIFQLFILDNFSFTSILIKDLGLIGIINSIFINPYNYPLWFLRDLMLVVLFSPLIHLIITKVPKIFLFIILIFWFFDVGGGAKFYFFKSEAILFFSIGSYLSIYNVNLLKEFNFKLIISLVISYLILVNFKTYLLISSIDLYYFTLFLHKISILIGIFIIWNISNYKSLYKIDLLKFTFIFYVFHEPFLSFSKKIGFYILGSTPLISLLLYLSLPIILIFLLYYSSKIFQKIIPKFTSIITGGRI